MRPHTHAPKQGRATPPSVEATRRHGRHRQTSPKSSPQATFLHEPTDEPRATKRHDTDETTPPQCHRGQTSDKSDDEKTPRDTLTSQKRPPDGKRMTSGRRKTASGHHQTAGDAERATLRHHAHALTHHERRRICTRARARRVQLLPLIVFIYIFIFMLLPPCVYLYYALIYHTCIFIHSYVYLCGSVLFICYYLLRMRAPCA